MTLITRQDMGPIPRAVCVQGCLHLPEIRHAIAMRALTSVITGKMWALLGTVTRISWGLRRKGMCPKEVEFRLRIKNEQVSIW